MKFLFTSYLGLNEEVMACLRLHPEVVIVAQSNHYNRLGEFRALAHQLMNQGLKTHWYSSSCIRKPKQRTCKSSRLPTWVP